MPRSKEKNSLKNIALDRVKILINEASSAFNEDKKLANDYVRKAKKIAMKVNLRIPPYLKRQYCKHCDSYLRPGKNLRVRTKDGKAVYYCLECKKFSRFKLNPKKSK